jgi:hypothetical protein
MAAPDALFTQAELETAYTAEVVNQLLGAKGRAAPDTARVDLVRRSATGLVLGKVAKAIQPSGIDTWWDASTTTERDKAELKRLALSAAAYYLRFYGQKAEEIPDAVLEEMKRIEERADEIGRGYAVIGSNSNPAAAPQNDLFYAAGSGHYPTGSGRKNWKSF